MWWFWVSSTPTVCLAGNYSSSYPPPRGSLAVLSAHSQCFRWHLQWCYLPVIHLNLVWKNQIKQFVDLVFQFDGLWFYWWFGVSFFSVWWGFVIGDLVFQCWFGVEFTFFSRFETMPDAPIGPFVTNSCHPVKHWDEMGGAIECLLPTANQKTHDAVFLISYLVRNKESPILFT